MKLKILSGATERTQGLFSEAVFGLNESATATVKKQFGVVARFLMRKKFTAKELKRLSDKDVQSIIFEALTDATDDAASREDEQAIQKAADRFFERCGYTKQELHSHFQDSLMERNGN